MTKNIPALAIGTLVSISLLMTTASFGEQKHFHLRVSPVERVPD